MIPTRVHGIVDYLVGILLLAAPFVLGFDDGGPAQWTTMSFGLAAIAYSIVTDYEFGSFRLLPMPAHLALDWVWGLLLALSPWMFGFSDVVRWPHVAVGVAAIVIASLTERHRRDRHVRTVP